LNFLFLLAEKLGRTVGDLLERMTPEELILWSGYLERQHEQRLKAERRAQRRR
jgi:hypothetical protein